MKSVLQIVLQFFVAYVSSLVASLYILWKWFARKGVPNIYKGTQPRYLTDPTLGQHRFIKVNGVKLHYLEAGCTHFPLMILIHGVPDFSFTWRRQIPFLATQYWYASKKTEKNYFDFDINGIIFDLYAYHSSGLVGVVPMVIAINLRGCGDSEVLSFRNKYSFSILAKDIACLIHSLGKPSARVMCLGFGGIVGWQLIEEHPKVVEKIAFIHCPHPYTIRQYLNNAWAPYIKLWYLVFVKIPFLPEILAVNTDFAAIILRGLKKDGLYKEELEAYEFSFSRTSDWEGPFNILRNLNFFGPFNKKKAPTLMSTPVLLIMGDSDDVFRVEDAYRTAEYVERIAIRCIGGDGRVVHVIRAALVNQLVENFFQEVHWKPLSSTVSSSVMTKVVGAGLAAVSTTVSKTSSLSSGFVNAAQSTISSGIKMAEHKLWN